ncbi:DNA-binding response regulator [Mangrovactinospora gilvigrisea]|uniref:Sensory transduction protein RegX3 n=1 Tax=Mangrovactinospora gilvigrisea TaxID=1428644 RepID=A0A1J7BCQ3_9ACTN|nr:response regulator transcription factor [Mangrovactinospora gilvigrisea]OIV36459.1 DNA-binding response regulator [Mangrovactinospora gilvigrisea]
MRLLLVEDDEHVAGALAAVLRKHGFDVRPAGTAQAALDALLPGGADGSPDDAPPFDVVLLDLGLPDRDGFEVCGRIRDRTAVPVIMVTARSDIRSRIHGLNLGADDYLVKPYDLGELVARIHAVARRSSADEPAPAAAGPAAGTPRAPDAAPGPLRLGPVGISTAARAVTVHGGPVALTRKEFDLLALLARRPGVVYRREQIIAEVWRTSWEGTARTLEVHVASLRAKLGVPGLVETVRGVGYRLAP